MMNAMADEKCSLYEGKLAILLASFNGYNYIEEQLESICGQTFQEWQLFIRDDLSCDGTTDVIRKFILQDRRIHLVEDRYDRFGACNNFGRLMEHVAGAGFPYYCFSDQDDVWDRNKLEFQLQKMGELESRSPGQPVLVHSDLEVVDASMKVLDPSFMHFQDIQNESCNPLQVLLAQNFVTGCTVMINRALLDITRPMPGHIVMHDWWLALCAATFGQLGYIDQPLVKYRQHDSNEVGAKNITNYLNPFKVNWWKHWLKGRNNLLKSIGQARLLAERIKQHDPENQNLNMIMAYASLSSLPWWQRIRQIRKYHIHCQSKLRHYLMVSRLLTLPGQANE